MSHRPTTISWLLSDGVYAMRAYVWCYQPDAPISADESFARWLWGRALARLAFSNDWHRDFAKAVKRATELAYIDFNHQLVMPELFKTLSDELLSDLAGFFVREAA